MSLAAIQLDQRDIERFISEHFASEGGTVRAVYFGLGADDPRPIDPEVELTATVVFK